MELPIYIEPKNRAQGQDERIIAELEKKSKLKAIENHGNIPSLDELLYGNARNEELGLSTDASN